MSVPKGINWFMRLLVGWTHFAQFAVQWGIKPRPEWFDHFLDQYWQWGATNNSLWVERGVFSRLVLKEHSRMLEICCGDGFNTRHFYSTRARSIIALDFDEDAIPHARRYDSAPNITFIKQDTNLRTRKICAASSRRISSSRACGTRSIRRGIIPALWRRKPRSRCMARSAPS